jgi:hypothetical protein
LSKSDGEENSENGIDNLLGSKGVISQPIVWISLYFVATTGGGVPEGPFGIFGAVEGLAYLSVVGLVFRRIINSKKSSGLLEIAENLSIITLGASLLVLASLISKQGCIPMQSHCWTIQITSRFVIQRKLQDSSAASK